MYRYAYNPGWYPMFTFVSTLCTTLLMLHSWQNSRASRSAVPSPSTTITPMIILTGSAEIPSVTDINTSKKRPPMRIEKATQSGLKQPLLRCSATPDPLWLGSILQTQKLVVEWDSGGDTFAAACWHISHLFEPLVRNQASMHDLCAFAMPPRHRHPRSIKSSSFSS